MARQKQGQQSFPRNADYRLFVYAMIVADTDGVRYVKFGDTRQVTFEDARRYAFSETTGKARGIVQEKDLLGVWDMTEYAIRRDPEFNPTLKVPRKGFDNRVRGSIVPFPKVVKVNLCGGHSLELHPIPQSHTENQDWREQITKHMDERITELNTKGLI